VGDYKIIRRCRLSDKANPKWQDVPEDVRMLIVDHSNPDVRKIHGHNKETATKPAILKLPKLNA